MGLKVKTFFVAGIIEIVSLIFLGWNLKFLYGLVLGTAIAIGNFSLLTLTSGFALKFRRGVIINLLGYIVRLIIYGAIFFYSYKVGTVSGIGTLLGFITLKLALIHEHGIKPGMKKKREV